jgi:hypothetical protein
VDLKGPAQADYDAGILLFRNGDFEGALTKFQAAYQQSHAARVLWNMAACDKSLGRYVAATTILRDYAASPAVADADRTRANGLIDTMRAFVTRVHLRAEADGARVSLDGKEIGRLPLPDPTLVDLGAHVLRLELDGYEPFETAVHGSGNDDVAVTVVLRRARLEGRLTIVSDANALIRVDDAPVGDAHWDGTVPAGGHRIQISAAGMRTYSGDVVVREKESRTLEIHLDKQGSRLWIWLTGGGAVVAAGLATGAYFLFRPHARTAPYVDGTIPPYYIVAGSR